MSQQRKELSEDADYVDARILQKCILIYIWGNLLYFCQKRQNN